MLLMTFSIGGVSDSDPSGFNLNQRFRVLNHFASILAASILCMFNINLFWKSKYLYLNGYLSGLEHPLCVAQILLILASYVAEDK